MSEAITESVVDPDPASPAPADPVVETPAEGGEDALDGQEANATGEQLKPSRGDRRFANLTARNAALEQQLASEQRAREAAEALLRANNPDPDPNPPARTEATIRAQVNFEIRRDAVIARGNEAFGTAAFAEKAGAIVALGAAQSQPFMDALVELPNAEHIVAALADDTDTLVALLGKSPLAMAAEMGRMAAKIEAKGSAGTPAKPLSRAPTPVQPVTARSVEPAFNPYAKGAKFDDYLKWREANAPKRLGGRG